MAKNTPLLSSAAEAEATENNHGIKSGKKKEKEKTKSGGTRAPKETSGVNHNNRSTDEIMSWKVYPVSLLMKNYFLTWALAGINIHVKTDIQ